ncbi:Inherit from NOG: tetratricopeptide repeat domain 38 [Seminavis robusta]|uniref:Inherit from NOG: tetratricopeptide repeat domain 38 n=1 Tax=Seminavis robusta TaxID=568900 RepID=A0A9N8H529_9STRA|nr:Inherit from NOG: tetratricopeptide repeat domain 38 [Seminavis robusta]|eukprot:Sro64_g036360.1 Inherit from NOG: tetratricopeptide repeat domain 38 (325) ;mRNA; r:94813-95787
MLQLAQAVQELIENTPYAGGVLSFAMHMAGDSMAAEQVAQSAIRKGFDDPWTIHAVAHALSSQGRAHECALWLEQHRAKSSNCNAFMKGHMEFHLALCFIDTCDQAKLDTLIATNLWGTMSKDMKAEYWNAAALLNVLWKAEIHNVKLLSTQKSSDCIEEALQNVTDALSGAANKSKSLVFSLCIFRYTEGSQRDEWNKELIIISPNDESESDETQKVLSALASAISIVYHHGGGDANDNDKWEKAAKLIAPVADKLETLGASPEQREVLEDFVGLVGMMEGNLNRKKSKNENENTDGSIDLQAWYNRNQRPNVSFYERIMAGK